MRAFVTSVGEKTTGICVEQLEKVGFKVVLLDDPNQSWESKYRTFITKAHGYNEDCFRVDADVIIGAGIRDATLIGNGYLIKAYCLYDLYRNGIFKGSPIFYTKKALGIIDRYKDTLHPNRPESSACRLDGINPYKFQSDLVVGMHGFFQDDAAIERAKTNKTDRKQQGIFDFELVEKLMKL